MLKKPEIQIILERLGRETVRDESSDFPFRITRSGRGYSKDPTIAKLQAKLSIMLEAART